MLVSNITSQANLYSGEVSTLCRMLRIYGLSMAFLRSYLRWVTSAYLPAAERWPDMLGTLGMA